MSPPRVSVIIATYNRSVILRHVLNALRFQTFENWEAIVVGDACTDDTASAVAACDDARFRFVNLPRNHGEQSAANNEGIRLARGDRLAFLNHDDFWRRDHLERSLECLERDATDLVYSWTANLLPDGAVVLLGPSPRGHYSPDLIIPASSWVFRNLAASQIAKLGLHPLALWMAIRHPGRGAFLAWLRQRRGLPARDKG